MATEPFLLLLDEPAAGMNPLETKELVDLIVKIRNEEKISILLIEHDMKLVMSLSDRIFVMDYGKKIAQGTPTEIKNNPAVIKPISERMLMMLSIKNIKTYYGNIQALKGVSIDIDEGEIITLIGPTVPVKPQRSCLYRVLSRPDPAKSVSMTSPLRTWIRTK